MEHVLNNPHKKFMLKIALYSACFLSFLLFAFTVWQYQNTKRELAQKDEAFGRTITEKAGNSIEKVVHQLTKPVDDLARDISEGKIPYDKIIDQLKKKSQNIYGLGVAFLPHTYPNKKLYAPYFVNKHNIPELVYLENFVDYSKPSYHRFTRALQQGSYWHNPFWDDVTHQLILEYATPFYDKNHTVIGVVFGSYSIDYIQKIVQSLYPANFGYGALVRKDGTLLSHPNIEYIGKPKTELDIAHDLKNFKLEKDLKDAFSGKTDIIYESSNFLSGQDSLLIFQPIKDTDWFTKGVFVLDEFSSRPPQLQRQFINSLISFFLFLVFLLLVFIYIFSPTFFTLWITSISCSLALLTIISFIWYGLFHTPFNESNKIAENSFDIGKIIREFNVEKSLKNVDLTVKHDDATGASSIAGFTLIPTGIYLHELLLNTDSIIINGYVWQQIPVSEEKNIVPGVIFPQAKELKIEQAYKTVKDNILTIGWAIRATLVENFNFFSYPLDSKSIRIQLWPNDFEQKVILVPDFNGYKAFNPTSLPGINRKIKLASWNIDQSYYSYQKENRLVNFGYHTPQSYNPKNNVSPIEIPQLYFNVITSRHAVGPLALTLMPIVIILVLLFILLLMAGIIEFQFMFGSIASLFFTSLIAYTAFKTYLSIQNVVFMDYVYFLLQGSILLIAILAIVQQKKIKMSFLAHRKMLIPQLLFWPFILGSLLIISLVFFY